MVKIEIQKFTLTFHLLKSQSDDVGPAKNCKAGQQLPPPAFLVRK
jgi:hypothetical protein